MKALILGLTVIAAMWSSERSALAQSSDSPVADESDVVEESAKSTEEASPTPADPNPGAEGASSDSELQPRAETEGARGTAQRTDSELPTEDTESFNLQLRKLQDKVDQLKQRVYNSKARLTRLKEVVMHGAISGAKALMTHKNEMGSSFRLTRIQYSLDGATIFNRTDSGSGELDDVAELVIFDGSIAPGEHQLSLYLEYAGDGFGIFSYLENYQFKIKSSYTFTVEEGKLTSIDIIGYEKGNFTTELKDRVAVRYAQSAARATQGEESEAVPEGTSVSNE